MDNSLLSKSVKINIQPAKIKEDQKVGNEKLDPDVQDSVSDPLLEVKVDDNCCNGKVESNCQVSYHKMNIIQLCIYVVKCVK